MRGDCVYLQVMVQMYLRGWDSRELAEKAGLSYTSIRRKLRGMSPMHLEEARSIQKALKLMLSPIHRSMRVIDGYQYLLTGYPLQQFLKHGVSRGKDEE